MKKALLLLSIALVLGCLQSASVPEVEVSPDGVRITAFSVDKNPVQSNELIGFLIRIQNVGEMPADDACICIKRKGGFGFPTTVLCPSCTTRGLNAPDARIGMPGQTHEVYWQVRAPEIQFPLEQQITAKTSYKYTTVATKEIPILTKERIDELRESTAELYKGASTLTKSPVKLEIQAQDPIQVDLSGTKAFPFDIVLSNIGKGNVERDTSTSLGWCGDEKLNCIDSLEVSILEEVGKQEIVFCEDVNGNYAPYLSHYGFEKEDGLVIDSLTGNNGKLEGDAEIVPCDSDSGGDKPGNCFSPGTESSGSNINRLIIQDFPFKGSDNLLIDFWAKTDDVNNEQRLFYAHIADSLGTTTDAILRISLAPNQNKLKLAYRQSGGGWPTVWWSGIIPGTDWHHYKLYIDYTAEEAVLVVDDATISTKSIANIALPGDLWDIYLGSDMSGTTPLEGQMDNVLIKQGTGAPVLPGTFLWQGKDARVKCKMYVDLNTASGMNSERYPVITATAGYKYHIEDSVTMEVIP